MDDREVIERHGGSAELARKLNMTKPGSTQRVNNWKTRGIPSAVKLERPDLFSAEAVARLPLLAAA